MTKKHFNWRNMVAIAISFTAVTMFSGCNKNNDPIDNGSGNNPEGTPAAVTNLTATAGNAQAVLTWNVPTDNGGSTVMGYELTYDNWATKVSKAANELSHTYTGLSNGTQYTFKVRAVNAKGAGAESTATTTPTDGGGNGNSGIWTAVANTAFDNFEIHDIAYGGGTFVAGDLNRAAYSSDGITWTAVKVFDVVGEYATEGFVSIAYGGGRFVAIGNDGRVAYSTSGAAWTPANSTINSGADIAYGGGRFVACGSSGGLSGEIAYSSNGEIWAESYNTAFSESYPTSNGIAYGAGKFVTVGDRGQMAYSTDGVIWNAVADSKFGQMKINGIDYCNDRFIAFGYAAMAYSTDGITWTKVDIPNGSLLDKTDMKAVSYGGGKFVVVADKGKMAESSDCVTWTEITETTFGYAEIYDIIFGDGKFVAVGFSEDTYRGHIAYHIVE